MFVYLVKILQDFCKIVDKMFVYLVKILQDSCKIVDKKFVYLVKITIIQDKHNLQDRKKIF